MNNSNNHNHLTDRETFLSFTSGMMLALLIIILF